MKTTLKKHLRAGRFALSALPLLFLFSCDNSGSPSCRITETTVNGETWYEYVYNADNEMITIINYDDGILYDAPTQIVRNADGKVASFDNYSEGTMVAQQVQVYSGDRLLSSTLYYDDNDDGISDVFFRSMTFGYTGDQIASATELYSGQEIVETYTWTDGNITRITSEDGSYRMISYDEKPNPLKTPGHDFLHGVGLDQFQTFTANNIVKIEYYDDQDALLETRTFAYTYNDQDFPVNFTVEETGDEGTFQYNCD